MRRLGRSVSRSGVGVHSGRACAVTLSPAPWGTGLQLRVGAHTALAHVRAAVAPGGCSVLRVGPHTVAVVEHLLAALVVSEVTDGWIDVEGPEIPILDGSALPWWEAIHEAGLDDGPASEPRAVDRVVHVQSHGGEAWLRPDPGLRVSVEVAFPSLTGGAAITLPGAFETEVAPARTFVLAEDVERLRAAGRGRGATSANTVVWGAPGALRFPDEPVRHKLLDAIGDLGLAGGPIRGHLHVVRGSHALHQAVLRAWLEPS
ncbi:MAG: UDP-3-O-[3-hydroxymyristoyl] N-acetylglucosamine deacetylase [Myxococcota bacterium]